MGGADINCGAGSYGFEQERTGLATAVSMEWMAGLGRCAGGAGKIGAVL